MLSIIESFRADSRWVSSRRFAPITWSLFAAVAISPVQPLLSLPLAFYGATALFRLQWLLPHEKKWLAKANEAITDLNPEQALAILSWLPLGVSEAARFKGDLIKARAYISDGKLLEAHRVLNNIDRKCLLPSERQRLRLAWARLHFEAENLRDFFNEVDSFEVADAEDNTEYALLKALAAEQRGQFDEARQLLQRAMLEVTEPAIVATLYNNLANVELAAGFPLEQTRLLRKAHHEFKLNPRPIYVRLIYHNLAFALARAGDVASAKALLQEAWEQGDRENPRYVLEVLNTSLLLARETGDPSWLLAVHAEFDSLASKMQRVYAGERVALAVTGLRALRNDGVPIGSKPYIAHVQKILDDLVCLNVAHTLPALIEIMGDVNHELSMRLAHQVAPDLKDIQDLMNNVANRLVPLHSVVETFLQDLPRTLVSVTRQWMDYRHSLDKAEIMLADPRWEIGWEANLPERYHLDFWKRAQPFYRTLFANLRENAERFEQQGVNSAAVQAWIMVCDEFTAYRDQLDSSLYQVWDEAYKDLAMRALNEAKRLLNLPQEDLRRQADHLVGVARFQLLLGNDPNEAAHYIARFDALGLSLNQYALWFREQYNWAKAVLAAPKGL